jgi:hypothetical protein
MGTQQTRDKHKWYRNVRRGMKNRERHRREIEQREMKRSDRHTREMKRMETRRSERERERGTNRSERYTREMNTKGGGGGMDG